MMIHGRIEDNRNSRKIGDIFHPLPKDSSVLDIFLRKIGGRSLKDLRAENPKLLIFPREIECVDDNIEDSPIFHVNGDAISTGNVMGFVGTGGVSLSISSRFYPNSNDFFLHYLLQKVVGFHVVDLPSPKGTNSIWDFLPYLFPSYFMAAWKQGIFKLNRRFDANNDQIKGAIDIPRHIRHNIPFRGKVAYTFSQHTPINPVNQLIRLTIEVLEHSRQFKGMFHGTNKAFNDAIRDLKLLLPLEALECRSKIIKANLRPIVHPFYLKYRPLQKLCLAILRHEKMTFGENDEDVVGLLFNGSWLWEEYLAKIMPEGIIHAENIRKTHPIYALKAGSWEWYPDFYREPTHGIPGLVFDAKYKHGDAPSSDQHQIVSYMYVLRANTGGFIYPHPRPYQADAEHSYILNEKELNGYGGMIRNYNYPIAVGCKEYQQFIAAMQQQEQLFTKKMVEWSGQ